MARNSVSKILKDGRKSYYSTVVFPTIQPDINDIYIITEYGDRLDKIAFEFYKDTSLWWVIADVNSIPNDSLFPEVGIQLRIPQNIEGYLESYQNVNQNR